MNLHAIANGAISAINPNFVGEVQQSAGYIDVGDAQVVGSITGNVLTVTGVTSGNLAASSVLTGPEITGALSIVAQIDGTPGGVGAYQVSGSQTCASNTILAQGSGARAPTFWVTTCVTMQVQPLNAKEIDHLDSLNIQGITRGVYINGRLQGLNRAGVKGGDVLRIPTCLTDRPMDTWLVAAVLEPWDNDGWTKVAVTLQNPPQDQ